MHASPSSLLFMAFLAGYLAIRGVFIRRTRREKAVSRNDLRDRLLVLTMGLGQVVLPFVFVTGRFLHVADRAQGLAGVVAGALAMVAGLWLFWRSHADLGESWSVTLELNADHRLVTRGVYAFVRHPMYLSFIVLGIGQALLLANWIAGLSGLVATALLVAVRLPHEEAMMLEAFGDEYRDYMRRTGRLLPRLS